MKSKKLNGFDRIAPVYDRLVGLIFGKSIRTAQLYFLSDIPKGGDVLILGGGTGWLLAELLKVNPDCQVWYVEASRKMLEITQKKVAILQTTCVHYIHGTAAILPQDIKFNAVITNFYLDLFSSASLHNVLNQIIKSMLPHGVVLISDFINTNVRKHRILLNIMYRFFRLVCGIESTQLPDWQKQLKNIGLGEVKSKLFYGGFIKSSVYCIPDK